MNISPKKDSLFWKTVEYVVYAFFVLFPFLNYTSFLYGPTSTRSVNIILVVSVIGILYACWLFKKTSELRIFKSPILFVLSIYFLCLLVSGISGVSFHTSFWSVATRTSGIWYFIHLGIFMLMLLPLVAHEKKFTRINLCIILSTALYSVLGFFGPEGLNLIFKGYKSDAFTFGNSTFAGMYIFGAFLLSIYYIVQSQKRKWWMYTLPVLILISPNIINKDIWFGNFHNGWVGEARATTYTIVFSIVSLVFVWLISKIKDTRKRSITSYSLFGLSLVGLAFFAVSLLSHNGYVHKAYLSQATAARPIVWQMSENAVHQKPFFGWGTDNFERMFEIHYDNRLLQDEFGNEAWFDRAHNMFVDQAIDNGLVGLFLYLLMYVVLTLALLYVALNAREKKNRMLACFIMVYFGLHILELQTAFDTTISYPLIALVAAVAIVLFHKTKSDMVKPGESLPEWKIPESGRKVISVALILFFLWSLIVGAFPFIHAQIVNGYIRTVGSSDKRMPLYPTLFGSQVDEHAFIWRTSTDFQRGISANTKVLKDPKKVEGLKKEIAIFEAEYRKYLQKNPTNFRAHLNLADILIYQTLFGVNKLPEAQQVLDNAIKIVPQSPQPYWMKAVAYIYMKKFDLAREAANKGLELNPKIKQSQQIVTYVEESIKNFPDVELFFFRQI